MQSKITVTSWLFEAETRNEGLLTGVIKNSAAKAFSGGAVKRKKTCQLKHSGSATSPPSYANTNVNTSSLLDLIAEMNVNVRGMES